MKKKKHKKFKSENIHFTSEGIFSATMSGFGFVDRGRGKPSVFIPVHGVGNAIHGDRVKIEITDPYGANNLGPVGKIIRILERRRKFIVGELQRGRDFQALDEHFNGKLKIVGSIRGMRPGDWVKVRLLEPDKKFTDKLRGEIVENLGAAGSIAADLQAVSAEFNMPEPYTEQENQAATRQKPLEIAREDLRSWFTITIDPADAKDFDDAISLTPGPEKGTLLLGVHIADVAAWVRAGKKLDKAASERGFSSYVPGMFRPMLPGALTALISLRQGVDSPAHSVIFTIRESTGRILSWRRVHSRVRIDARLNYDEVQSFIENSRTVPENWSAETAAIVRKFITLTRKMRKNRQHTEHPLPIDTAEVRILIDPEDLSIQGIRKEVSREAEQIVEECMLAANSAVATEMIERKVAGIYRLHDAPDPAKLDDFSRQIHLNFRCSTGDLSDRLDCESFLHSLEAGPRKSVIISNFLRSLPHAVYDAEPGLHYGLGKYRYAHFTSPIRRYTDLLVHRQLWQLDTGKKLLSKEEMAEAAAKLTDLEERNDNAYFAASDRLKLHYLHAQDDPNAAMPKIYESVIAKVVQGGLLCDIEELGFYGFVPASKLNRGLVHYSRKMRKMRSERGHSQYKCGDILYVVLDSLDFIHGKAVFRPV